LRLRSVEGFLFPSLYESTQHTRATDLVANQISAFGSRWRGIDLRRRRAARRAELPLLPSPPGHRAALLHGERARVLHEDREWGYTEEC
jgi:hypothetical protein